MESSLFQFGCNEGKKPAHDEFVDPSDFLINMATTIDHNHTVHMQETQTKAAYQVHAFSN